MTNLTETVARAVYAASCAQLDEACPSWSCLSKETTDAYTEMAQAAIEAAGVREMVEALDMCRMIIKFHVKNAGACCSKDGMKTVFSAGDAFKAACEALDKYGDVG